LAGRKVEMWRNEVEMCRWGKCIIILEQMLPILCVLFAPIPHIPTNERRFCPIHIVLKYFSQKIDNNEREENKTK
jgi:hypothetical protein